jgi:hypothetical protein
VKTTNREFRNKLALKWRGRGKHREQDQEIKGANKGRKLSQRKTFEGLTVGSFVRLF